MNDFLMLVGIVIIGIAVSFAMGYFILRVTSYYKSRFRVSMGPSVITVCLSVDLFAVAAMLYGNGGDESAILIFNIIATLLISYGVYRDIKNYQKASIGAIGLQLLIALLQVFVVSAAIVTIVFRKVVKRRNDQLNTILNWTKFIWNM